MDCIDSDLQHAEQHCQNSGKRLTVKRKQVLAVLLKLNKAASAYDIIDCYAKAYGEVLPAMSIYRILDFLEQQHFVHKLRLANKYVACSQIDCTKNHQVVQFLICTVCDKVEEIIIDPATFEDLNRSAISAGFYIDVPQLEINCVCKDCR